VTLDDIVAEAIEHTLHGDSVLPRPPFKHDTVDVTAVVLARLAPLLRAAQWAVDCVRTDPTPFVSIPSDLLAALNTWNEEQ
jgi:hypothetical protein